MFLWIFWVIPQARTPRPWLKVRNQSWSCLAWQGWHGAVQIKMMETPFREHTTIFVFIFVCLDWHGWTHVTSSIFELYNCNLVQRWSYTGISKHSWGWWGTDFSNMAPGLQLDHQNKLRQMASSRAQNTRMYINPHVCIKPVRIPYQWGCMICQHQDLRRHAHLQQHDTNRFLKPGLCSDKSFWNQKTGKYPHHIFPFQGSKTSSVWCLFNG